MKIGANYSPWHLQCNLSTSNHNPPKTPKPQFTVTDHSENPNPSPQTMPHCSGLVLLSIFSSIFLIFIFGIESWAENLMELLWFWGGLVHFWSWILVFLAWKVVLVSGVLVFFVPDLVSFFNLGVFVVWSSLQSLLLSFRWSFVWVHCSICYLYVYF